MKIVATTPLPAVDRPNADRWNATRSPQYLSVYVFRNNACVQLHKYVRK